MLPDIKYAVRNILKRPAFAFAVVVVTALGIGANTAIFTVVNALLLRPLPYDGAERIMMVYETEPQMEKAPVTPADFYDWREQNRTFESIAAFRNQSFNLAGGDSPERIRGMRVSSELFQVFHIQPLLGRVFASEDDQPGGAPVVVISEGLWRRRFGSDPNILGQSLPLNGLSYTVVGVVPTGASFPFNAVQIWSPFAFKPSEKPRDTHSLSVVARLKPGVSLEQAQSEMSGIAVQLQQQYPNSNKEIGVKLVPLNKEVVGNVQTLLFILFGAVGLVLFIACANVANLLLARSVTRQREIAVRTALGASRVRIVRQLLVESIVLSLLGGVLGLLLAKLGIDLLVALKPTSLPRLSEIDIDTRVLLFTLLTSVLTGIVFGLIPARESGKLNVIDSLKEGKGASNAPAARQAVRSLLVVAEVGFSLALLIGAGLMIESFQRLQKVDPGFDAQNVLAMDIALPAFKYPESQKQAAVFQQMIERVKTLPGVQDAGVITSLPLSGGSSTSFDVEGRESSPQGNRPLTEYRLVSEDYFRVMSIPLIRGRFFTEQDTNNSPKVVIINETLARQFFADQNPVGQRIGLSGPPDWREIVGVVRDVRDYGLDANVRPTSYVPYQQNTPGYLAAVSSGMSLVVRAPAEQQALAATVSGQIRAIDKDQPVANIRTMNQVLSDSVAQRRFNMSLLSVFAGLALLLALVGVYSVMAYLVTQRRHEFGVRMALGARPSDILRLVIGQGLKLLIAGVSLGLVLAFILTRALASLLYGVSATDPLVFASLSLLLVLVGLLASYVPARRATRIDPLIALRHE